MTDRELEIEDQVLVGFLGVAVAILGIFYGLALITGHIRDLPELF